MTSGAVEDAIHGGHPSQAGGQREGGGRLDLNHSGLPILSVALAAGVLCISIGYALSRASQPGARVAYLVGELLIAGAPVFFVFGRRALTMAMCLWLAVGIGIASFLASYCYSPTRFLFEDEYQHVRTAHSILATHHLFGQNSSLPVSPRYPGMELVTTALASISHLSIFAAGTTVMGLCHVAMIVLIGMLALELGLQPRTAALAVIVFAAGFDFQFFLSYFAYQTFAMPFLIGTLIMVVKLLKAPTSKGARGAGLAAIALGVVTITSHHVTSYFLLAMLVVILVVVRWRGSPTYRWDRVAWVLMPLVLVILAWNFGVASGTAHYLTQIKELLTGQHASAVVKISQPSAAVRHYVSTGAIPSTDPSPLPIRVLSDLAALIIAAALPLAAIRVNRHRDRYEFLLLPFVVASTAYYVLAVLFLLAPGADQLVARGQALILIPVCVIAALALDPGSQPWFGSASEGRAPRSDHIMKEAAVVVIAAGGVLAGWPPFVAKLPSPYQIAAFERSTDQRTVSVGTWMLRSLPAMSIFGADRRESLIVQAISGHQPVTYPADLFESTTFRRIDAELVQRTGFRYLIADGRLVRQLPAEGSYFTGDPLKGTYARPLPTGVLAKFDSIAGVSRIYDDGVIVVYDLGGSRYYRATVGS